MQGIARILEIHVKGERRCPGDNLPARLLIEAFQLRAVLQGQDKANAVFAHQRRLGKDRIEAPGIAELIEKDGMWEYTTPEPLLPELYSYSFIVDGLRINDPSNVYLIRDVSSVSNVLIIGGGRADLYKVNKVPHGTVAKAWYSSPSLGMDRRLTVYTPAGYQTSGKRYPVFYLLHGKSFHLPAVILIQSRLFFPVGDDIYI